MVEIKFGQELWSDYFKLLTFWYQRLEHFQSVCCSSYSLIFAKLDISTNKRYLKRNSLKSKVQIKFGERLWSHFLKVLVFCYQWRVIAKIWAGVLPVCCSLKLNFRERKGPKVWTPLSWWFKLNWDKC